MNAATGNTENQKSVLRNKLDKIYVRNKFNLFKVVFIGLFAPHLLTNSNLVVAATAPNLGTTSSFGTYPALSSTQTRLQPSMAIFVLPPGRRQRSP
jgi:hypothetical protein